MMHLYWSTKEPRWNTSNDQQQNVYSMCFMQALSRTCKSLKDNGTASVQPIRDVMLNYGFMGRDDDSNALFKLNKQEDAAEFLQHIFQQVDETDKFLSFGQEWHGFLQCQVCGVTWYVF